MGLEFGTLSGSARCNFLGSGNRQRCYGEKFRVTFRVYKLIAGIDINELTWLEASVNILPQEFSSKSRDFLKEWGF